MLRTSVSFDLRTTEKLGNELVTMMGRSDHGITTPAEKRARVTAIDILRGKLYEGVHYEYVVLDEPNGQGLLAYALAHWKTDDLSTGGDYRISLSPDGTKALRVDLLSQLIPSPKPDIAHAVVALASSQIAGKLPVEAWIYASHLDHTPMYVAIMRDGSIWAVANGRIVRSDDKGLKNHLDILNKRAPEKY